MAVMGLFRRLTNKASFTGAQVPVMAVVLAITLMEAVRAKLLCFQVLETGAQSVLLLPSLLARPSWFCASQPPPQKERQRTSSASPIGHLILGTRTCSGSITHVSCQLCCHLARFFLLACFPVHCLCKYATILCLSLWSCTFFIYLCCYQLYC